MLKETDIMNVINEIVKNKQNTLKNKKEKESVDKIQKKAEDFIMKTGMLSDGDRVIAGVSGGADSVFLFYLLIVRL